MKNKKKILVDFDGVIHDYHKPFRGECVIDHGPIIDKNGLSSIQFLKDLIDYGFYVQIFSSRCSNLLFESAADDWFEEQGLKQSYYLQFEYSNQKNDHDYIIDDRANFEGVFPTMEFLENFKPWNKR